ncbi:hypothetical protein D9M71_396770 [compost metagenome]
MSTVRRAVLLSMGYSITQSLDVNQIVIALSGAVTVAAVGSSVPRLNAQKAIGAYGGWSKRVCADSRWGTPAREQENGFILNGRLVPESL